MLILRKCQYLKRLFLFNLRTSKFHFIKYKKNIFLESGSGSLKVSLPLPLGFNLQELQTIDSFRGVKCSLANILVLSLKFSVLQSILPSFFYYIKHFCNFSCLRISKLSFLTFVCQFCQICRKFLCPGVPDIQRLLFRQAYSAKALRSDWQFLSSLSHLSKLFIVILKILIKILFRFKILSSREFMLLIILFTIPFICESWFSLTTSSCFFPIVLKP